MEIKSKLGLVNKLIAKGLGIEVEILFWKSNMGSIKDFKKSLEQFIDKECENKPLVFIVDELDRCRPNYAVSILEQIKHFFSVKNIVFVLSIDKEQLGHAVKGVYGSDCIESDEYLRRFIDIEYSIPDPEPGKYLEFLYQYYKFHEFFKNEERISDTVFSNDRDNFLYICQFLFSTSSITLRQ